MCVVGRKGEWLKIDGHQGWKRWVGKGKGHRSRGKLQTGRNGKWLIEARE